jgi:molybdopterin-guanine dinucleotide biosynthesis protein A
MGSEKAALEVGGMSTLERVLRAVRGICEEVVIAGGSPPGGALGGARHVEDEPDTAGPLAGLAAGLRAARYDSCLLVACDMPFLNPALLRSLLEAHAGCDAVVPVIDGRAQPLHAVYSRDCLPTVESLLRLGAPSARDLLPRLSVRYLGEEPCRALDPTGLSAFNMNDPSDLELARRQAARIDRLPAIV